VRRLSRDCFHPNGSSRGSRALPKFDEWLRLRQIGDRRDHQCPMLARRRWHSVSAGPERLLLGGEDSPANFRDSGLLLGLFQSEQLRGFGTKTARFRGRIFINA
jgi:hypothetical protein